MVPRCGDAVHDKKHLCLCDTEVHVLNDVFLKAKYGQLGSVEEGLKKSTSKMEKYGSHLDHFKKKWGFDYEFIYADYRKLKSRYSGTLVGKYIEHNPLDGPINKFNIEQNIDGG